MKTLLMIAALAFVVICGAQYTYADPVVFVAALSGPAESPPNASPGTGFAVVTYDNVAHTLRVQVVFSGLTAGNTASHIHCCTPSPGTGTAGVATVTPTFTGFPGGTTAGAYDRTFDLTLASSWNPTFVSAQGGISNAEVVFSTGLFAGTSYLNIHSGNFPGGEIRGFLVQAPEPATILLLGSGLAGIGLKLRRRRKAIKRE